jgi:hypothetical protein
VQFDNTWYWNEKNIKIRKDIENALEYEDGGDVLA